MKTESKPYFSNPIHRINSVVRFCEVGFSELPNLSAISRQTLWVSLMAMKGFIEEKGECSTEIIGCNPFMRATVSKKLEFAFAVFETQRNFVNNEGPSDYPFLIRIKICSFLAEKICKKTGNDWFNPFSFEKGHTSDLLCIEIGSDSEGGVLFLLKAKYNEYIFEIGAAKNMEELMSMGIFIRWLVMSYDN